MARIEPTSRTAVRRKPGRGNYDRATIEAILDEGFLCNVAVVVDGRPLVLPTAYARGGEWVYLHGARNNALLRAVLQGEACISVTLVDGLVLARSVLHHSMNYRSVVLFGQGDEISGREEKFEAMRLIVEHIIPGRWEDARLPTDAEVEATLVIRFPIDECSAKIRTGPPIDDDADLTLPVWAGVLPAQTAWLQPEPDPQLPTDIPLPDYVTKYARPRLPRVVTRPMRFDNGMAIGVSNRWRKGQYCSIFTKAGIVGCGVYDIATPTKFGQAIAIARGTPEHPLVEPEDLLDAKIVDATGPAKAAGIEIGMTGREAVEKLLSLNLD